MISTSHLTPTESADFWSKCIKSFFRQFETVKKAAGIQSHPPSSVSLQNNVVSISLLSIHPLIKDTSKPQNPGLEHLF